MAPDVVRSGPGAPARDRRLRSDPTFRIYWTAHSISATGSTISLVVLPVLMYQLTGSATLTALLESVYITPYLVFGLLAGTLADRVNRRALMVGCDLISALALGCVPLADLFDALTVTQLFVATAVAGTGFVGFDAGQWGALVHLFGRERQVLALSALGSVDGTLSVVGTAAAGGVIALAGAAAAVWLDAASFLASAMLLAGLPGSFGHPADRSRRDARASWRDDMGEGVRFLWRNTLLRSLTLAGAAASLTGGAVFGLLVVYGVRQLGLSDSDWRLGLLFSAGGAGALLATVAIPALTRRWDIPRLNLVGRTISLVLVGELAVTTQFAVALVAYSAFSLAEMIAIRSAIAFRQLNTPDHLQGRVNVLGRMTALAGQPIGAALGGVLAATTDVRTALLVMSCGLLASTVGGWISPLRRAASASEQGRA